MLETRPTVQSQVTALKNIKALRRSQKKRSEMHWGLKGDNLRRFTWAEEKPGQLLRGRMQMFQEIFRLQPTRVQQL